MLKDITIKVATLSEFDIFDVSYYIPLSRTVYILSKLVSFKNCH